MDVTGDLGSKMQSAVADLKAAIPDDLKLAHEALDALVDNLTDHEQKLIDSTIGTLKAALVTVIGAESVADLLARLPDSMEGRTLEIRFPQDPIIIKLGKKTL